MSKIFTVPVLLSSLLGSLSSQQVEGTVTDLTGDPVSGAVVYTVPFSELTSIGKIAETNAQGHYSFPSPINTSQVTIAYRGTEYPGDTIHGGKDAILADTLPIDLPEDTTVLARSLSPSNYFVLEAVRENDATSLYFYARPEAARAGIYLKGNGIFTLGVENDPSPFDLSLRGEHYAPPSEDEENLQEIADFLGEQMILFPLSQLSSVGESLVGILLDAADYYRGTKDVMVDTGVNPKPPPSNNVYVIPWRNLPVQMKERDPVQLTLTPNGDLYAHALFDYTYEHMAPHRLGGLSVTFSDQGQAFTPDFSRPENTLEAFYRSSHTMDIDLFEECVTPDGEFGRQFDAIEKYWQEIEAGERKNTLLGIEKVVFVKGGQNNAGHETIVALDYYPRTMWSSVRRRSSNALLETATGELIAGPSHYSGDGSDLDPRVRYVVDPHLFTFQPEGSEWNVHMDYGSATEPADGSSTWKPGDPFRLRSLRKERPLQKVISLKGKKLQK